MNDRLTRAASVPPSAPGAVTRDVKGDGWHVRLDLAPQVLSLEIPPVEVSSHAHDDELLPVCPHTGFVSASMLAVKAKLFDDGLYAAAELASQPAKAALLMALTGLSPTVAAAARLGGLDVDDTPAAHHLTVKFLADKSKSKPLGIYTWNETLRRIFRQDRMLQEDLTPEEAAALASALRDNPSLGAAYARQLDFVSKLTNALSVDRLDLRQPGGGCFFPPSRSHEDDLAKRLVGQGPVPPDFSLAREMVKALRFREIDLRPTPGSGWYDLQTWALEPLVLLDRMPEGARLRTNVPYQKQLEELFKAILSLTRETHVKLLEGSTIGLSGGRYANDAPGAIRPGLTVEPVRTYYERRAHTYEFVRDVLERDGRLGNMRRFTERAPAREPLAGELAEMIALFRGAAAVAGHQLGMEAASSEEAAPFTRFAADPDVSEDIRMMVPVFYDRGRRKTKVWAIVGWDRRTLTVDFAVPPAATMLTGRFPPPFRAEHHRLAFPVFAEAWVSRLLDRDEFRAHCDRYKTAGRILAHLEADSAWGRITGAIRGLPRRLSRW